VARYERRGLKAEESLRTSHHDSVLNSGIPAVQWNRAPNPALQSDCQKA
jgi:hypothetical protein